MPQLETLSLQAAAARRWDVIVIGAGMGGGLAARRLAEAGLAVLMVEKGEAGYPTEASTAESRTPDPRARLLRGLWPGRMQNTATPGIPPWFGPLGCGPGGSSVFYAAALERPARHDVDALPERPHPSGGWPVGFDSLLPYFDAAARLLHLTGEPDPLDPDPPLPLAPPPAAAPGDAALLGSLRTAGLHPYRLNLGLRFPETCRACFGRKCPHGCKMDGRSAGVLPALASGRAALLTGAEVLRITAEAKSVNGLEVEVQAEAPPNGPSRQVLTAATYVLAAGALNSPRLLMRSGDLANSSGWVGRGLMFHLNEIFALWSPRATPASTAKSIALRDFCTHPDRFGMVQSLGVEADYGAILNMLGQIYESSPFRRFRRGRGLMRIPAAIAARLLGSAGIFVGFLEDTALDDNRVLPPGEEDRDTITLSYRISPELARRRKAFRKAIRKGLRGHRVMFLRHTPQPNFGHPAGTLRFGPDPATSVLDPDCRAHDLNNLYVVDASFMPSSLGVNPSLTIAANALRVADRIVARHRAREAAA